MQRPFPHAAAALAVAGAFVTTSAPLSAQDASKDQVDELVKRVTELEQKLATKQAIPASAPTAQAATQEEPAPGWKDLISPPSKFKIYGFARLDVQYDDSRPNNTQTIGWILSEDPAAPAPIGAGGNNKEDLNMHARLSRLGFDFNGGKIAGLGDPAITGKIEIDFFNNGLQGQSESRAALRMRHAWMKLAWGRTSLLAGQTNDVISPLFPIINADLVMWGAGNLGDRRPQLRVEHAPPAAETGMIAQFEMGLTGADDNSDLDTAGTFGAGYRDGETSGKPTLQARLGTRWDMMGQKAEGGVWAHRAWEEPDTSFAGKSEFDSTAFGFDLAMPVYKDVVGLKAEAWTGENVDDVRGGIFQGINRITGEEIESRGGFVELSYKCSDHLAAYVGYSTDNPDNADVGASGRAENVIYYTALRWNWKPLYFGLEYLNWTTEYVGLDEGDDNRVVGFIQYSF